MIPNYLNTTLLYFSLLFSVPLVHHLLLIYSQEFVTSRKHLSSNTVLMEVWCNSSCLSAAYFGSNSVKSGIYNFLSVLHLCSYYSSTLLIVFLLFL